MAEQVFSAIWTSDSDVSVPNPKVIGLFFIWRLSPGGFFQGIHAFCHDDLILFC
jgi:hypothetical protein